MKILDDEVIGLEPEDERTEIVDYQLSGDPEDEIDTCAHDWEAIRYRLLCVRVRRTHAISKT